MTVTKTLERYYAERAAEYESIYERPERQRGLARLRELVERFGAERRVLEVACGTGYWTSVVARRAGCVVATDIGEEVLAVARTKRLPSDRVRFLCADAYALHAVPGAFDACLMGFWWSHLPRGMVGSFLRQLHERLGTGAAVLVFDNSYVEGSSTPISREDDAGNTYQMRSLRNGATREVLKNFPSPDEVFGDLTKAGASRIELEELTHYWAVSYVVGEPPLRPTNSPA